MKLEFKNVTKQYGEVNAVNKVNCVMEKGIYGLLGVNGAGKTTLMRMLCTIVQPSEGQILWNGKDIWKLGGEYREVLGYLPQDFGYYPDLTVYDYMMYISSIKGLKIPFARKKVKQLLNQVGMEKFSKRKMKNLSGGMVRRVGIAQAMLNDPQILVLDEPTAGLDPNERIRFRNLISELSEERLVLLSTHIVSDIEYIANNIMLMKDGELFYAGTALISTLSPNWCSLVSGIATYFSALFFASFAEYPCFSYSLIFSSIIFCCSSVVRYPSLTNSASPSALASLNICCNSG